MVDSSVDTGGASSGDQLSAVGTSSPSPPGQLTVAAASTPPPPPGWALGATFTVAGDVTSFDQSAFTSRLLALFPEASAALVDASAASVRVDATLQMSTAEAATRAVGRLEASSVGALSDSLGVQVEAVSRPVLSPPKGSDDAAAPPLLQDSSTAQALGMSTGSPSGDDAESVAVVAWRVTAIVALVALAVLVCAILVAQGRRRMRARHASHPPWWAPAAGAAVAYPATPVVVRGHVVDGGHGDHRGDGGDDCIDKLQPREPSPPSAPPAISEEKVDPFPLTATGTRTQDGGGAEQEKRDPFPLTRESRSTPRSSSLDWLASCEGSCTAEGGRESDFRV